MNSINKNDASNICLACGLCCDGTLIGFVELTQEEAPRIDAIKNIENEHNNQFFLQPCDKFCDGCTIYADRPTRCGEFECGLLKSVEKKELSFDIAVKSVKEIKEMKSVLQLKISEMNFDLKSHSFFFRTVELKKFLEKVKSESKITNEQSSLLKELNVFNDILIDKMKVSLF